MLTDEQIDAAHDVALRTYRHSQSQIRGQQLMPSDDPDWHFARAIEAAACAERDARIAKLERQLVEARNWIAEKPEWRKCSAGKMVSDIDRAVEAVHGITKSTT